MTKVHNLFLALLLTTATATVPIAARVMASPAEGAESSGQSQKASLKPVAVSSPDIPFHNDEEFQNEQKLLALANQSRRQAGAPALTLDPGLSEAARTHAQIMLDAQQLSHQFHGEPSLPQRLATATHLLLDQEGENVALDYDAEHGHQHLMLSPPHRANLLNPAYNVVGLGVVRSGDRLFIVQDFAHALPNYSPAEAAKQVAAAVNQMRRQSGQPELQRNDLADANTAACSMAQADKLGTSPAKKLAERFTVLTYTSLHPDTLPAPASHAISSGTLHSFSVGACYRRTDSYPTGVYWMVLSLY
jgi:uncharacterized protein YkwD